MTYTATLSSTLAKLSTLKEKSKYTRYLMDLYCTEEETIHNALSVDYSGQRYCFRRSTTFSGL